MIKIVAIATALWALVFCYFAFFYFGTFGLYSSLLGSTVMLINLFGVWLFWKLVFLKKSIAFVVLVIIFKYLILGMILWNLTQFRWFQPMGFIIGLSALLLGIVSAVFFKRRFI